MGNLVSKGRTEDAVAMGEEAVIQRESTSQWKTPLPSKLRLIPSQDSGAPEGPVAGVGRADGAVRPAITISIISRIVGPPPKVRTESLAIKASRGKVEKSERLFRCASSTAQQLLATAKNFNQSVEVRNETNHSSVVRAQSLVSRSLRKPTNQR